MGLEYWNIFIFFGEISSALCKFIPMRKATKVKSTKYVVYRLWNHLAIKQLRTEHVSLSALIFWKYWGPEKKLN